jgi:hypothetical protein
MPWYVSAPLIRDRIGSKGSSQDWKDLWDKAQLAASLSAVMLKRYVAALVRIEEIADSSGRSVDDLIPSTFTGAELAIRFFDKDSKAGLQALADLRERRTTIEDLRRQRAAMTGGDDRFAAMKERSDAIERCEVAVGAATAGLFGPEATAQRRPALRYFRRLGFEFLSAEDALLGGADLYLAEPATRGTDPLEPIAQSVLLSRYLPVFWIVFGPGSADDVVARAEEILAELAPAIGVLRLRDGDPAEVVRAAQWRQDDSLRAERYRRLISSFGGRRSSAYRQPS